MSQSKMKTKSLTRLQFALTATSRGCIKQSVGAAAATIVFLLAAAITGAANLPEKPHLRFIAVDDLRLELSCSEADHIHSPNIDRLASEGLAAQLERHLRDGL